MASAGCFLSPASSLVRAHPYNNYKLHWLTSSSYNAAIFQIATFNDYNINVIDAKSEAFFAFNASSYPDINGTVVYRTFSGSQWLDFYNTKYVAYYGDLTLAIDRFAFGTPQNGATIMTDEYWSLEIKAGNMTKIQHFTNDSVPWSSAPWIDYRKYASLAGGRKESNATWPASARVTQSFARRISPQSRIQLSLDFMIVVICMNLVKLSVMLWVLFKVKSAYIVTLGDAAASFLEQEDPWTTNQCMLSKYEVLWGLGIRPYHDPEGEEMDKLQLRLNGIWLPYPLRYFASLATDRQVFFALL